MTYEIVDIDGTVLGEYDDYAEANERLNNINDQLGPVAVLNVVED